MSPSMSRNRAARHGTGKNSSEKTTPLQAAAAAASREQDKHDEQDVQDVHDGSPSHAAKPSPNSQWPQ